MGGLELAQLQLDCHKAPQRTAEEQEIQVEIVLADAHPLLAGDEGENHALLHLMQVCVSSRCR